MSKSFNNLHNDGQEDGSHGNSHYDPPHSVGDVVLESIFGSSEDFLRMNAENDAYDKGFVHGRDQRD